VAAPLLKLDNIEVVYDRVILVLKGVSLEVPEGGIVALLGANGAGKSTTLKAISNILRAERGDVTSGRVEFRGERIDGLNPDELVRMGIVQVMEGRRLFEHLTVEENLRAGAYARNDNPAIRQDLERVYTYFPRLKERRNLKAGYLSGGEQQMAAIGRGLMARPKLMLLDEPSMGLAPMLVKEIFSIVARLNQDENVAVLLAEQNAKVALSVVDYGYVLENGRIALQDSAEALRANADIKEFYLGFAGSGEFQSFRELKHYKRRERWI
jgi:branched-chain amino acid transport system ATP-binding protein